MSIETEITRISTNVSDTLSAVSEMGGEVPEGATSNDMAAGVRSIPVGAKIDDTTPSSTTVYSSQKIESVVSALNQANAAQDTEIAKKANAADLAAVAKSGNYTDLTNKPTIPTVPSALPNPNKLKLTGAVTAEYDGSSEVSVEIPAGGGSAYELPIASDTQLGGVMPVAKTDDMTQAVGVDEAGGLWALPGGGEDFELIREDTLTEDTASFIIDFDAPMCDVVVIANVYVNDADKSLTSNQKMEVYINSWSGTNRIFSGIMDGWYGGNTYKCIRVWLEAGVLLNGYAIPFDNTNSKNYYAPIRTMELSGINRVIIVPLNNCLFKIGGVFKVYGKRAK